MFVKKSTYERMLENKNFTIKSLESVSRFLTKSRIALKKELFETKKEADHWEHVAEHFIVKNREDVLERKKLKREIVRLVNHMQPTKQVEPDKPIDREVLFRIFTPMPVHNREVIFRKFEPIKKEEKKDKEKRTCSNCPKMKTKLACGEHAHAECLNCTSTICCWQAGRPFPNVINEALKG